jgi:hypothetical protein
MVKALAFEVEGPSAVAGATREYLASKGYLSFKFKTHEKAREFAESVARYLPGFLARVCED